VDTGEPRILGELLVALKSLLRAGALSLRVGSLRFPRPETVPHIAGDVLG
jgi:hypothetical protein